MKNLLLTFCVIFALSCTSKEKNYHLEVDEKGNIRKITTVNDITKGDSTVTYYFDNGNIAKVIGYKNGEIYPSTISFYETGGVYIVRQYVNYQGGAESNQIYTFDKAQNIMPEVSCFSIVNRDNENNYKLEYLTGFGKKNFNVCIINRIEPDRVYCEKEIALPDSSISLFEYNPKKRNIISLILPIEDSRIITFFVR